MLLVHTCPSIFQIDQWHAVSAVRHADDLEGGMFAQPRLHRSPHFILHAFPAAHGEGTSHHGNALRIPTWYDRNISNTSAAEVIFIQCTKKSKNRAGN